MSTHSNQKGGELKTRPINANSLRTFWPMLRNRQIDAIDRKGRVTKLGRAISIETLLGKIVEIKELKAIRFND